MGHPVDFSWCHVCVDGPSSRYYKARLLELEWRGRAGMRSEAVAGLRDCRVDCASCMMIETGEKLRQTRPGIDINNTRGLADHCNVKSRHRALDIDIAVRVRSQPGLRCDTCGHFPRSIGGY